MDLFAAQRNAAVDQQIRIAEISTEHGIVILRHRAQQQRTRFLEQQLKLRQNARVPMIQALGIAHLAADVAALIEHCESIAMFQRARAPLLQVRADGNRVLRRRCVVDRVSFGSRIEQCGCSHERPNVMV